MRVLFVSDEVAPFTSLTGLASLVRTLPEMLHENAGVETRIMMPRYGLVSERRNRLHEVIRLSGSEIAVGGEPESLKVKVASIPGIRLQVYFMDNARLFKRKGIFQDRNGKLFPDNPQRAAFFGQAVIKTISNLGWQPDVVHAFGWLSGMVPYLLRTEYAKHPLFVDSKVVYTPQAVEFDGALTAQMISDFGLKPDDSVVGLDPGAIGSRFADATIRMPSLESPDGAAIDADCFTEDAESDMALASSVYERIQAGVAA
jgi:starch synthase